MAASLAAEPRDGRAVALLAACVLACVAFAALGTWQVQRRGWKLGLIERVEQRVHAAAVDVPDPSRWPQMNADDDAYRHVRVIGSWLEGRDIRVQAVTTLGSGWWVLTPLQTTGRGTILVNRGFVPADAPQDLPALPAAPATVTGLLRMTEPHGGFLRDNDAAANRWYSRDVAAIAASQHLGGVAPYFIDAEAIAPTPASTQAGTPVPGLTVTAFRNHHLVYACTWYTLAAMSAWAASWVWRTRRKAPAVGRRGVGGAGQRA